MRTFVLSSLLAVGGCALIFADAFAYPLQVDESGDPAVQAVEAAEEAMRHIETYRRTGTVFLDQQTLYTWSRRLAEAKLAAATNEDERVDALNQHVERTKTLFEQAESRIETGGAPKFGPLDLAEAKYFLAQSRMTLHKEQERAVE